MALATKCPHCKTTFRVASDQLKLRGGIVRCGTCQQVFDGNASLVDLDAPTPAPVPVPAPPAAASEPDILDVPELEFGAGAASAPASNAEAPATFTIDVDPDFETRFFASEPEPDDDYIAPASDGFDPFDALVAEYDQQPPELPKRGHYVLDFDLSEPAPAPAEHDAAAAPDPHADDDSVPEPEPFVEAEFNPPPDELPEPEPFVEDDFATPDEPLPDPEPFNEAEFYPPPDAALVPEPEPFSASEFGAGHDDDNGEMSLADEPGASSSPAAADSNTHAPDLETGPLPLLRASAGDTPFAQETEAPPLAEASVTATTYPDDPDEPEFVRLAREQELAARRRRLIMGAGSALLALVLLIQGVTIFRNVLVAKYPAIRGQVSAACQVLRCKIELPAQIEAISVETGEFQTLSPTIYRYSTVLRNDSGLVQAWPHLELVLKDGAKVVVRRVFTPVQYLPPGVAQAKGFAPQSEQAVTINFELKQLTASGFSIAVFYP